MFHCESAEAALKEILTKENPQILSIGETHPYSDDGAKKTTLKLFADKLLPIIAALGFGTLVVEGIYSDSESDLNVAAYMEGNEELETVSSRDYFPSESVNRHGQDQLLQKAKRLGVKILGGGPRTSDREVSFIYDDFLSLSDDTRLAALMQRIAKRSIEKTLPLARSGKKVALFGGAQHNDIRTTPQTNPVSFGHHFKDHTRYKFVEVDILSPELMDKGNFENYDYPEYERWLKTAVPESGTIMISRGKGSYTIVLPKGTLER